MGAKRSEILLMVIRQAFILVLIGSVGGLIGSTALSRVLTSLLFSVAPTDLGSFGIAAILLALVQHWHPMFLHGKLRGLIRLGLCATNQRLAGSL